MRDGVERIGRHVRRHGHRSLTDEVLAHLPRDGRGDGDGQSLPQQTEKSGSGHEDQPIELVLTVRGLDLRGDSASASWLRGVRSPPVP